ncbi:unnamed protein product [Arctia plantaginis]|uniref:Dynein regulatory complex protein 10 n=1 Tax=Arctia plantaginis TaxID=874455 RepID=A0A8S0Z520_ARCPL|nr:unnamed protein product [Arctia plantaginis]
MDKVSSETAESPSASPSFSSSTKSGSSTKSDASANRSKEMDLTKDNSASPIDLECLIQMERITKILDEAIYKCKLAICLPDLVAEYKTLSSVLSSTHMDDLIFIFDQYDNPLFSASVLNMAAVEDLKAGDISLKNRLNPELSHLMYIMNSYPELRPTVYEMIEQKRVTPREVSNCSHLNMKFYGDTMESRARASPEQFAALLEFMESNIISIYRSSFTATSLWRTSTPSTTSAIAATWHCIRAGAISDVSYRVQVAGGSTAATISDKPIAYGVGIPHRINDAAPRAVSSAYAPAAGIEFLNTLEQFRDLMIRQMETTAADELMSKINTRKLETTNKKLIEDIEEYSGILKEENDSFEQTMAEKAQIITKLEHELSMLNYEATVKLKKKILDSERQMVLATRAHLVKNEMLLEEEFECKQNYELLLKQHMKEEKNQRARRFKVETQLCSWLQKYDLEMADKQVELDEFTEKYEEEVEKCEKLQKKLDEQDIKYIPLMKERDDEYDAEMTAKMEKFLLEHAARIIQFAWREVLSNRAEKKKLKKLQKKMIAAAEAAAAKQAAAEKAAERAARAAERAAKAAAKAAALAEKAAKKQAKANEGKEESDAKN